MCKDLEVCKVVEACADVCKEVEVCENVCKDVPDRDTTIKPLDLTGVYKAPAQENAGSSQAHVWRSPRQPRAGL